MGLSGFIVLLNLQSDFLAAMKIVLVRQSLRLRSLQHIRLPCNLAQTRRHSAWEIPSLRNRAEIVRIRRGGLEKSRRWQTSRSVGMIATDTLWESRTVETCGTGSMQLQVRTRSKSKDKTLHHEYISSIHFPIIIINNSINIENIPPHTHPPRNLPSTTNPRLKQPAPSPISCSINTLVPLDTVRAPPTPPIST